MKFILVDILPVSKHFSLIYSGSTSNGSPLKTKHGLVPSTTLASLIANRI